MTDQPQPIISIRGENIALGPIRRDLMPTYQRWMNQLEATRFLRMSVYSLDGEVAWYENLIRDSQTTYFLIYDLATLRSIGGVDLHKIDATNRTAEVGILIGESDARGKGFGTEAVKLMCDFGFNALGLHSIMLLTSEWNVAGQKAYEKAGFKEVGRRRESRWFAGRYWDDIYYDLLASEFESPVVREMILEGIVLPENENRSDR